MENERWKKVEYTKTKIKNSGSIIRNPDATTTQITEAKTIINNWRAAHAYPLHVFYVTLRKFSQQDL